MPVARPVRSRMKIAAALTVLVMMAGAASGIRVPGGLQSEFTAAAVRRAVPERLLLAVSYLQSRWETNAWQPSTSGGYGPMHLIDPAVDPAARGPGPTLDAAAKVAGRDEAVLRSNLVANLDAGAALLASYQREAKLATGRDTDLGSWYGAVARYSGASDTSGAGAFADNVYDILASGAERVVPDGTRAGVVRLPATKVHPNTSQLGTLGLPSPARPEQVECPDRLACDWVAGAYTQTGSSVGEYGGHDVANRPTSHPIEYIVVHDTECTFEQAVAGAKNPKWGASWHYTIRSRDGHVTQHIQNKDVAWNAGNWYINGNSIGIEHEGYAKNGGWFTESLYRSSAKLVGYLVQRYGVPLDRAHIIGHENVPGSSTQGIAAMHADPGPYWDWQHYFDLLNAAVRAAGGQHDGGDQVRTDEVRDGARDDGARDEVRDGARGPGPETILINPSYESNRPAFTGCTGGNATCPEHGSSAVVLRTLPKADAPLVADPGLHPGGEPSTMALLDHGARVSTGQRFAVADRDGDWIAIWYLGQQAWLHNPATARVAMDSPAPVATPKAGRQTIPVYGMAYPEAAAYPSGVPARTVSPLGYVLAAGQRYVVGGLVQGTCYQSRSFDGSRPGDRTAIRGSRRYAQIQLGYRFAYVDVNDVDIAG